MLTSLSWTQAGYSTSDAKVIRVEIDRATSATRYMSGLCGVMAACENFEIADPDPAAETPVLHEFLQNVHLVVALFVKSLLSWSVVNSFWIPPDNGEFRHDSFLPRRPSAISASRSDTNSKAMAMPSADLVVSGCFNKEGDEQSVLYLLAVSDVSTKRECRRESNWGGRHPADHGQDHDARVSRHLEVNAFPHQLRAYNRPQH